MTREAGQINGPRLLAGGLVVAVTLSAIVGVCTLLRERGVSVVPPRAEVDCDEVTDEDLADVRSAELLACPERYDGRTVTFSGEVVGSLLERGNSAWLQLNDDRYGLRLGPLPMVDVAAGANESVAVTIPTVESRKIGLVGGADAQGDRVTVVGTFHASDPGDAGNPTIRAEELRVLEAGRRYQRSADAARTVTAVGLLFAAAVVTLLGARQRRR